MPDNTPGGKKRTATTTDEQAADQESATAIPEDAVLRREGRDCTFFYRKQNGTLVERPVFDDGEVGAVYQAGGDIDPESEDVDVLEADAWPIRDDDLETGSPVLVADGGSEEDRSIFEIDLVLRQTTIVAVEADSREEAWEALKPPLDRETQRALVQMDFSGADYQPEDVIAVDDVDEADIVVDNESDDGLRTDGAGAAAVGGGGSSGRDLPPMDDLTRFKLDALRVIEMLETPKGTAIKSQLEEFYETDVYHGRLYTNLDSLVEDGLVAKSERDRRTNNYELTGAGQALLNRRREWLGGRDA